jgi:2,3-bisphosphoglycerate-independent phosphoglycerate mutase
MPGTVTVGCKLPNGLHLDLKNEAGARIGERVTLRGFSVPYGMPALSIVGGYALTPNVDADYFEKWMKANENSDLVKKGFIFAHVKMGDASAQAKEMAAEKSGLEPMDPEKPGKGLEKVGVGM